MNRCTWYGVSVLLLMGTAPGCNLLTPLVFVGEHRTKVAPEFDKLPGQRVAVLVYADRSPRYDYPFARLELASYLVDKLSTELGQRNQAAEFVDPREVEDFLQRNLDAEVNPQEVGVHFKTDYVVYVEVLEFHIRDAKQPQFLQGAVEASVSVHDVRTPGAPTGRFELVPVRCLYPEGVPVVFTAANAPRVRESLYRLFAEITARKFYEHTVAL